VKVPRIRIAWVMVAVAVAALNFWAMRVILGPRTGQLGSLLAAGALPMANVLAVGMLIRQRRPESRPFLLGFESFGAMALALYVVLACFFHAEVVMLYLRPVCDPMEKAIGWGRPFVLIPVVCSAGVVMLGLPQVVFALVGGLLSRRFRITFTPR
jgi:hypothetical protein